MTTLANLTTYLSGESASILSAINETRGGLKSLIASLDPAAAATDRYNKQVSLLEKGMRSGALTTENYDRLLGRLRTRYEEQVTGLTRVSGTSGMARAGMQQLSFQIGDVATQFASGTKPMVIFAQQGGQVIQALGMMTNSTKGFLGFLGGPWGQIITAALVVLTPFVAKLFDTEKAAKAAGLATSNLSDVEGDLADVFGKTSSKIAEQNELLLVNARIKAANLRLTGMQNADDARKLFQRAGQNSYVPGAEGLQWLFGAGAGNADVRGLAQRARDAQTLAHLPGESDTAYAKRQGDAYGQIIKDAQRTNFNRSGTTQSDFLEAISKAASGPANFKIADLLDKSLDQGSAVAELIKPTKGKRAPKDRSDQRDERFDDQLAQLQDQQLQYQMQLTSDVRERAGLEHQQIDNAMDSYRVDIEHQVAQKEISAEAGKQLVIEKEKTVEQQHALVNFKLDNDLAQQELSLKRAANDNAATLLRGELGMARTQDERRRIQLDLLDKEYELQKATLEAVLARRDATEIEKQIAQAKLDQLEKEKGLSGAAVNRETMGSMAKYLDSMPKTLAEVNEQLDEIKADGLKSLNDGLADAIMGVRSFGDVFKSVANQVIADILRIVIQQQLIKPLANLLNGGGGGGGGGLFSLFGGGGGGGSAVQSIGSGLGKFMSGIPGFASGGSFRVGGRGGIDTNLMSINGIPRAWLTNTETVSVGQGRERPTVVQLVVGPGEMFAPQVTAIAGNVAIQHVNRARKMSQLSARQAL